MKLRIQQLSIPVIGALFFMIFALYNNYPIVSGDSTTYLDSGFLLKVPDERPIFYGLFLRISSLGVSLWLSVFFQSLILAYVLIRFMRQLLPGIDDLKMLALLLIISLGTILSWYAGQIMPDIFTPILFLAMADYLLFTNKRKADVLLLLIILLSILTHFSHYIISTLFAVSLLGGSLFMAALKVYRKKAVMVLGVSAIAWLSLFTSNYIGGKGFVSSNVSHVFLMGKLAESGVLKTYLDKACPIKDYKICKYKDNLPPVAWEFVWDQANSPVFKEGGWAATKEEYSTIIHDIASRPKYWPYLAFKSVEATARQIVSTNIDEGEERPWIKFEKEHPLYQSVEQKFPHEINEFVTSKQNQKVLNIKFYDDLYVLVLIISSVALMFLLNTETKAEAKKIYFLLLLFLVMNAFATATFGNVLSRLNSRTIWLLPAVNILFIYKILAAKYSKVVRD